MSPLTITSAQMDPEVRIHLNDLLAVEPRVGECSNTSGIAAAIRSLLELQDGEHPLPEAVKKVLAQPWGMEVEGAWVQGCDLALALEKALRRDLAVTPPLSWMIADARAGSVQAVTQLG